jgi:hypothetical protein
VKAFGEKKKKDGLHHPFLYLSRRLSQKGSLFGFMRGQKKEEAEAFLI